MDSVGLFLGGLILLALLADRTLSWLSKSARKFPWCMTCGKNLVSAALPRVLPEELARYLVNHELPAAVASRFFCPKGHYQLWYIPRFGNIEKAFFLREEL